MAGYSAFRIFEESQRIDSSQYFLGLRLNMYIASALTLGGAIWFLRIQRRAAPSAMRDTAGREPHGAASDSGGAGTTDVTSTPRPSA